MSAEPDLLTAQRHSQRICVYTVLTGCYERLNAQPVAAQSAIPFICLSDDPQLMADGWSVRQITPVFPQDPIRNQRELKLRPWLHLGDFDQSLYIDNSVILTATPEAIFERYGIGQSGLTLPHHSFRKTVMDEFLEVSLLGMDDQTRIFEQLNHYLVTDAEGLNEQPYWAAVLLRDHRNADMRRLMEIWWAHVARYSRRDQLSFNMACRIAGFTPQTMAIDNHQSWFHRWPVSEGRDRQRGPRNPATSLMPPATRIAVLEKELQTARLEHLQTFAVLEATRAQLAEARPGNPPAQPPRKSWRDRLFGLRA
ncbi:MAG TPA: glycosyltransferase domain-containing protein [Rhizobiaceae bacterium]|nr:glycosyltransferase domain-containing protein [Rhizobiaceae bacterium]